MNAAEELLHRARSIEDEAWAIRFTEPMHSRTLLRLAGELRDIAFNLAPTTRNGE